MTKAARTNQHFTVEIPEIDWTRLILTKHYIRLISRRVEKTKSNSLEWLIRIRRSKRIDDAGLIDRLTADWGHIRRKFRRWRRTQTFARSWTGRNWTRPKILWTRRIFKRRILHWRRTQRWKRKNRTWQWSIILKLFHIILYMLYTCCSPRISNRLGLGSFRLSPNDSSRPESDWIRTESESFGIASSVILFLWFVKMRNWIFQVQKNFK